MENDKKNVQLNTQRNDRHFLFLQNLTKKQAQNYMAVLGLTHIFCPRICAHKNVLSRK